MKQPLLLAATACLLLITACKGPETQQGNTPPDAPLTVTVPPATGSTTAASNVIDTGPYQVTMPDGWTRKDRMSGKFILLVLVAPRSDNYNPNLNILHDSMNGQDFDGYIRTNLQKMAQMKLTNQLSGDMEINGVKSKYLTYSYQIDGREISIKTYAIPKDGSVYVLTGSCLASQAAELVPKFDAIAASFKLK